MIPVCNVVISFFNDSLLILYFILDSWRNWKMVYQRRHARGKKTSSFNEKGLRGLEDIGKYKSIFSY